ncbi:uncharacterized protein LOC136038458 [Artemia franciscana]|uniref:Uncharacterized protein n=1 Tax=Artemia franciscana TaxID=6661 RepID=A0AA88L766_ARTSF|nr:hypothetical protein QYM36_010193 [Artemia franciscana]KAK2715500.1 hypothetical protein QYM36_010193 [Artemia franciscana]
MEKPPVSHAYQHSNLRKGRSITSINFSLRPSSETHFNSVSLRHDNGLNSTVSLGKHCNRASVQISIDSSARTISASCVSFPTSAQGGPAQNKRNSFSVPNSPSTSRTSPLVLRPYANRSIIPSRYRMHQQNSLVPIANRPFDAGDLQGILMSQMDRCSELRRQLEYERFRLQQLRQDVNFLEQTLFQSRRRLEYNLSLSRHCPERLSTLREENEKLKVLCDRLLKEMDGGQRTVSVP